MTANNVHSVYLIAICGTGMASLAGLLKESGYHVTGSDTGIYPPMSTLLAAQGISIREGYKKENVPADADLVVIGNAVSKTNEEVREVLRRGIPYASLPEALGRFFLTGRKSLVVAGTHGKTTTTSMLSWVLHHAGRKPGFMVGGWMKNFDGNCRAPGGEFFVVEGDEYDTAFFDKGPKFLHYQPYAAILTGIEFDHADIYRDLEHIKSAFLKFTGIIRREGFLLLEHSNPHAEEIRRASSAPVETYGESADADWRLSGFRFDNGAGRFELVHRGKTRGEFRLPLVGKYNAINAAGVAAMALRLGLTADEIRAAFLDFKGVKRRQEIVGESKGVIVMDDFAHHPTAIHLTLEAVKEAYPGRRIWAVFEPRSATSRRNVFQNDFPPSFRLADRVVIGGLFAPEKIRGEERLDPEGVAAAIRDNGGDARCIPDVDAIAGYIASESRPNDLVLVMSSGGFGGVHQKILQRLG